MTTPHVPACTTPAAFAQWHRLCAQFEKHVSRPTKNGFCEDCTPEHQARMITERRCENPGVRFEADGEGNMRGVLPTIKKGTK